MLLVLFRTWGGGALQPLVVKTRLTRTNIYPDKKNKNLPKLFFSTCFTDEKKIK